MEYDSCKVKDRILRAISCILSTHLDTLREIFYYYGHISQGKGEKTVKNRNTRVSRKKLGFDENCSTTRANFSIFFGKIS